MTTDFRPTERGVAMVLSLFLMLAMSVIAASLMFMSQTETYASMNYRLMSQARYGAESGIEVAANYLMFTYVAPTAAGPDPLGAYTYAGVAPVRLTANNQPVTLSWDPNQANYPVAAVQTAFQNAVANPLSAGGTSVQYQPTATLMSMEQVNTYGGGIATVQTWQITSDGVVSVGRTAKVEVTAIVETQAIPAGSYGAFATNPACGALQFQGNSQTESYDSSKSALWAGSTPASGTAANGGLTTSGGNVGTNGNLAESGSATINGSLSSPRVGVGSCSSGNVDALSQAGHATVTAGVVQLPQALAMPTPTAPVVPTTALSIDSMNAVQAAAFCPALLAANAYAPPATCSATAGHGGTQTLVTLNPQGTTITMGNVSLSNVELDLAPGTYNMNSFSMSNQSTVKVQSTATGAVVLNLAGTGITAPSTVLDISAGALATSSYDASKFQIDYGGTAPIKFDGHAGMAAMIYAPNASATFVGGSDFYGAIIASTLVDTGNAGINYDRNLSTKFFIIGNPMLSSFSWKRF